MEQFIDQRMAEEIFREEMEKKKKALRKEVKITPDVLLRALKVYDPCFVSFWNGKKEYKKFHNEMGLLILKMKGQK